MSERIERNDLEQSDLERNELDGGPSARLVAFLEFSGFLAFALLSKLVLDAYIWRYSGPVSLGITLLLLTGYMRMRGWTWSEYGLTRFPGPPGSKKRWLAFKVVVVLVGFAAIILSVQGGAFLLGLEFMQVEPQGVEDRWGDVEGNLPLFLLWLGIIWTSAAFGEEMFFRGFLIVQAQKMFGNTRWGAVVAVIMAACVFGYGHFYYQGWRGFVETGSIGLVFGILFLVFRRNLWPLIIFHGLIDTAGFIALYLGAEA